MSEPMQKLIGYALGPGLLIILVLFSLVVGRFKKRRNSPQAIFKREAKRKNELSDKLAKTRTSLVETIRELRELRQAYEKVSSFTEAEHVAMFVCKRYLPGIWEPLLLVSTSTLWIWQDEWLEMDTRPLYNGPNRAFIEAVRIREGRPGWAADDAFQIAKKHQLEEYEQRSKELYIVVEKFQLRADRLSRQLEIGSENLLSEAVLGCSSDEGTKVSSAQCRVELEDSPREELERIRLELEELEAKRVPLMKRRAEIEEEELAKQGGDGPHRRAAGIPRDEKPN